MSRLTGLWVEWVESCAKKGGGRDMLSLSAVSHTHACWWVKFFLWFTSVEELNEELFSLSLPPISFSCYYFTPPLHSSLCPYYLSFMPASCLSYYTIYFHNMPSVAVPGSTPFSSVSRPLLEDLQNVKKKTSHTPNFTCRPLTGDFTVLMMGHSSFLNPHKSVDWLIL